MTISAPSGAAEMWWTSISLAGSIASARTGVPPVAGTQFTFSRHTANTMAPSGSHFAAMAWPVAGTLHTTNTGPPAAGIDRISDSAQKPIVELSGDQNRGPTLAGTVPILRRERIERADV